MNVNEQDKIIFENTLAIKSLNYKIDEIWRYLRKDLKVEEKTKEKATKEKAEIKHCIKCMVIVSHLRRKMCLNCYRKYTGLSCGRKKKKTYIQIKHYKEKHDKEIQT